MPIKADCEPPRSECCYSGYLCLRDGGVASLSDGKSKEPVLKADFARGFRSYGKVVGRHDRADLVATSIGRRNYSQRSRRGAVAPTNQQMPH